MADWWVNFSGLRLYNAARTMDRHKKRVLTTCDDLPFGIKVVHGSPGCGKSMLAIFIGAVLRLDKDDYDWIEDRRAKEKESRRQKDNEEEQDTQFDNVDEQPFTTADHETVQHPATADTAQPHTTANQDTVQPYTTADTVQPSTTANPDTVHPPTTADPVQIPDATDLNTVQPSSAAASHTDPAEPQTTWENNADDTGFATSSQENEPPLITTHQKERVPNLKKRVCVYVAEQNQQGHELAEEIISFHVNIGLTPRHLMEKDVNSAAKVVYQENINPLGEAFDPAKKLVAEETDIWIATMPGLACLMRDLDDLIQPTAVFVEGLGRFKEIDVLSAITSCPGALLRYMSGDHKQNKPVVMTISTHRHKERKGAYLNPLAPQMQTYLMTRTSYNGFPMSQTLFNWRARGLTVDYPSAAFYDGRMIMARDVSTQADTKKEFPGHTGFIIVNGKNLENDKGCSKENLPHRRIVLDMIQRMHREPVT
ncbi:hypothetical protein B0T24DRAFT_598239 [Lasiosphaeria ovina]|uniref:Uncharacterized protein n=1 Tax=Lasiosphaeria ovina TaxID=92902 RepID=A0AAE0JVN9_9PEZI|nr:hypothetical protein B0T24DRAFT_598239 [Lasiosphaeria ovina]